MAIAESGVKVDKNDTITINGKPLNIEKKQKVYFIFLSKPKRVLNTAKDERGKKNMLI